MHIPDQTYIDMLTEQFKTARRVEVMNTQDVNWFRIEVAVSVIDNRDMEFLLQLQTGFQMFSLIFPAQDSGLEITLSQRKY